MDKKSKILYVVIIVLFILLIGSVGYILYMQNNENNNQDNTSDVENNQDQDDLIDEENNQVSTLIEGRNNQIIYNEDEIYYTVTYLNYSTYESRIYTEKIELNGQKIKEAMIISGALTNDPSEDGFYIMDDGTVKISRAVMNEDGDIVEIVFENFEPLENYKVSKINEIRFVADVDDEDNLIFGTYCDIVTLDGEHITFTV